MQRTKYRSTQQVTLHVEINKVDILAMRACASTANTQERGGMQATWQLQLQNKVLCQQNDITHTK